MQAAVLAALNEGYEAVILVGSDCPFVRGAYLEQACQALMDGASAVLGSATDGGYVLLGLRQNQPALFSDIPWGGDQVGRLTRERLRAAAVDFVELAAQADIDRPEDLALLE